MEGDSDKKLDGKPDKNADKHILTSPNSKLAKVDLTQVLRQPGAWEPLDLETKQHLYSLLPAPSPGQPPHDINVNPLHTHLAKGIDDELRAWQEDLKEGRETREWKEKAAEAGRERRSGKFDEVLRGKRGRGAGAGDGDGG